MSNDVAFVSPEPAPVPSEAALLMEYDKAQDSAQHHDNLVWTVTGFAWGGSAVLMGFVVDKLTDPTPPLYVLLALTAVGLFLPWHLSTMQKDFRSVRNQKYARCLDIEAKLGMKQHTALKYRAGTQTLKYKAMLLLFAVAWAAIIFQLLTML